MLIRTTQDEYKLYLNKVKNKEYIENHDPCQEFYVYDKIETEGVKFIDRSLATVLGGVSLKYQKNGIVQINGLYSLKKGIGSKILSEIEKIIKDISFLRLNCLGINLKRYYEKHGFIEYLSLVNKTEVKEEKYFEMIKYL